MNIPGGQYQRVVMHEATAAEADGTSIVCLTVDGGGLTTVTMQIYGVSGDTITFEATIDGTNWVAVLATNLTSGSAATTATADGIYRVTVLGLLELRARVSTYSAGTIQVIGVAVA